MIGEEYDNALTALVDGLEVLRAIDCRSATNAQRVDWMTKLEKVAHSAAALQYPLIQQTKEQNGPTELGEANMRDVVVDATHCTLPDANKRIKRAEMLTATTSLAGDPIDPPHPGLSAAVGDGAYGGPHLEVIERFERYFVGTDVAPDRVGDAVDELADHARTMNPERLSIVAAALADILLPDGKLDDNERKRKEFFRMNPQDDDGMRAGKFLAGPEFGALLEALFAKFARPGMNNPDDENPITTPEPDDEDHTVDDPQTDGDADDTPAPSDDSGDPDDTESGDHETEPVDVQPDSGSDPRLFDPPAPSDPPPNPADPTPPGRTPDDPTPEERRSAARRDFRTLGQRQKDAVVMVLRHAFASGTLGRHRGMPTTVVATVTLAHLERNAGFARTGGGSKIPVPDLIRMAATSRPYLLVFDDATRRDLYLGRAARIASADQRIVLHAMERGCTFENCLEPGYRCEVHHRTQDWAAGGTTDITDLTFACLKHHRMHGTGAKQYSTSIARDDHPFPGRTLWHRNDTPGDPGRINHAHHPEDFIDPSHYTEPDYAEAGYPEPDDHLDDTG